MHHLRCSTSLIRAQVPNLLGVYSLCVQRIILRIYRITVKCRYSLTLHVERHDLTIRQTHPRLRSSKIHLGYFLYQLLKPLDFDSRLQKTEGGLVHILTLFDVSIQNQYDGVLIVTMGVKYRKFLGGKFKSFVRVIGSNFLECTTRVPGDSRVLVPFTTPGFGDTGERS